MRFMMSGVGVRSGDAAVGCYDHIVGDVKHDVKGGAKVRVASVSTTNWVMRFTMSGARVWSRVPCNQSISIMNRAM